MDANDAASYVQDLAGDNANIIFGAKYDESMTDEATITVIATGLENASAAPKSKIMPDLRYGNTTNVTRPVGTPGINRQAANLGASVQAHTQTQTLHHHFLVFRDRVSLRAQCSQWILKIPDFLKKFKKNNI